VLAWGRATDWWGTCLQGECPDILSHTQSFTIYKLGTQVSYLVFFQCQEFLIGRLQKQQPTSLTQRQNRYSATAMTTTIIVFTMQLSVYYQQVDDDYQIKLLIRQFCKNHITRRFLTKIVYLHKNFHKHFYDQSTVLHSSKTITEQNTRTKEHSKPVHKAAKLLLTSSSLRPVSYHVSLQRYCPTHIHVTSDLYTLFKITATNHNFINQTD